MQTGGWLASVGKEVSRDRNRLFGRDLAALSVGRWCQPAHLPCYGGAAVGEGLARERRHRARRMGRVSRLPLTSPEPLQPLHRYRSVEPQVFLPCPGSDLARVLAFPPRPFELAKRLQSPSAWIHSRSVRRFLVRSDPRVTPPPRMTRVGGGYLRTPANGQPTAPPQAPDGT